MNTPHIIKYLEKVGEKKTRFVQVIKSDIGCAVIPQVVQNYFSKKVGYMQSIRFKDFALKYKGSDFEKARESEEYKDMVDLVLEMIREAGDDEE